MSKKYNIRGKSEIFSLKRHLLLEIHRTKTGLQWDNLTSSSLSEHKVQLKTLLSRYFMTNRDDFSRVLQLEAIEVPFLTEFLFFSLVNE